MKASPKQKIVPLYFKTCLAVIKNSVGSQTFKNFYAEVDGKIADILENGELSCAYFVSSILFLFKYISGPHTTVDGTIGDLQKTGWEVVDKPQIGCVLVWAPIKGVDNLIHRHIGFYIGSERAVSNSSIAGLPMEHHWTYGKPESKDYRAIELILWNKEINTNL